MLAAPVIIDRGINIPSIIRVNEATVLSYQQTEYSNLPLKFYIL